jgi:PIN domain nuclease of toxin-antitoxin system
VLLVEPEYFDLMITETGFKPLPISVFHGEKASDLPLHHRDQFDSMHIAQAKTEGLQLMTKDPQLTHYGVSGLA